MSGAQLSSPGHCEEDEGGFRLDGSEAAVRSGFGFHHYRENGGYWALNKAWEELRGLYWKWVNLRCIFQVLIFAYFD